MTEKRYNGSNDSVKIAYNTQGQTFAVKDTANSRYTKFTYDLAGRVVRSATYPTAAMNGAFVTDMRYGYESKTNRLAEFSYRMPNQGSTTGEYRTANFNLIYGTGANIDRVTALQMQGENRIQFAYDGFGRVTNRTYSATGGESPRVTTYTYHDVGEDRTTSLVKTVNNSGLGEIGYTYDAVGNITQITKDGAVQESYTYDSLNQLKTVTRGGVTTEYSYQNGNITSVTQNGETVKTYGYTDSTWSDLLTSFNGQTITYDEIGNPLQYRDGMSFTWAKGRQLQSVTKNGVTTSYTYDENGMRLSKTTGGVTTKIYRTNGQMVGMNSSDGKDLMFLLDGSGNVYGLHYDHYSSETQTAAATYYFAYNAQGDVIGIYDAAGTVVATYAYDEWGNCTVQVLAADSNGHAADSPDHIAQVNPFRYRGYYYDNETGFYYLNSRYYDPETCRFLNADSQLNNQSGVLGKNLFAYCENNPTNKTDPTGHFGIGTLIGAAVGGLIGGISGAISAAVKGKSIAAGAITGAATGAIIGGVSGAIADAIATGGLSVLAGAAISAGICGVVAAGGNICNQYWNYHVEKKAQTKSNNITSSNFSSRDKTPKSNKNLASEGSFLDYIDYKSVAISGITAAVFAPIGVGANCIVNSAFVGLETGGINITAQVIANFAMGGNVSILQSIIDLF